MRSSLHEALANPDLAHQVVCEVVCEQCAALAPCLLRGLSLSADLAPLGDLRCARCGSAEVSLLPADLRAVLATLQTMRDTGRNLPQGEEAFLRDGGFRWLGQPFEDPRALRTAVERLVGKAPDDARAQLHGAAGMVQLRDMVRALELARRAHELASEAPEPLLLVAEVSYVLGDGANCAKFAQAAIGRADGPLMVFDSRERVITAASTLVSAGEALAKATAPETQMRSSACPCGSGRAFRLCCGGN